MPAGVALMPKLAMVPPIEKIVNPVAAVPTVRVSALALKVNAGTASGDLVIGAIYL
jgi:hypothetical protein